MCNSHGHKKHDENHCNKGKERQSPERTFIRKSPNGASTSQVLVLFYLLVSTLQKAKGQEMRSPISSFLLESGCAPTNSWWELTHPGFIYKAV